MSLRYLGINHEVVGISEIEPDAIIAYGSIRYDIENLHTDKTHDEMRAELIAKNVGKDFKTGKSKIPRMKKSKLEMLYKFDKAINNFGDVSIINPSDLPDFDYFTYSFPCTDISVAGKQEGIIKGQTRSGLLYECEKIIEAKRPKYLLMENVKNLVGKQFINQFKEWCDYLESLGYTNYHNDYKCLNAKDFGIAQNRERIFMVSILGEHKPYEFPRGFKLEKRLKDFLDTDIEDKYYLSDEIQKRFKQTQVQTENYQTDKPQLVGGFGDKNFGTQFRQGNRVYDGDCIAMCIASNPVGNIGGNSYLYKINHKGKEIELPCVCASRGRNPENPSSRVQEDGQIVPTLTAAHQDICYFEHNYRIRKLTPRECLRLMGVSDEDITKMQSVGLSDSSLYKLAGNSIVKNVLDALHQNMFNN